MHGFLLIDKPSGVTSHDIVRRIRRKIHIRRVGHGGTLDPMATGLVPVAIGDATRLLEYLSDSDKGYSATLRLGVVTDSQDAEGKVVATGEWKDLSPEKIEATLNSMAGSIEQVPPMFSALKKNGVPLYKLARQGVDIERPPRRIEIRSMVMTDCDPPDVSFDVICSKGTYVRTLAHDIGQKMGCGAHLTALRRFRHGPYDLARAIELEKFESLSDQEVPGYLIPLLDALPDLPLVRVETEAVKRLLNGVPPGREDVVDGPTVADGERVRLSDGERLLAVATFAPSRLSEKRGDFELAKVFVRGH